VFVRFGCVWCAVEFCALLGVLVFSPVFHALLLPTAVVNVIAGAKMVPTSLGGGWGGEAGTCSLGKSESSVHAISWPPLIQINWQMSETALAGQVVP
jgi:hypothetical protein